MRDFVLIYVNGLRHEVRGRQVFQSLSDFLRIQLGLTGTKTVCSEGDCGSCLVMLGRAGINPESAAPAEPVLTEPSSAKSSRQKPRPPEMPALDYVTVCSCIQYLYQLDCTHVVTVEGLTYDGQINPVQEALVRNHGAQCGFCTPGFVVALCAMLEENRSPDEKDARRCLVGNLCRCTGYESILKSATRVEMDKLQSLHELYPAQEIAREFKRAVMQNGHVTDGDRAFFKPVTLADACAYRAQHPDCVPISGGTDLGVQMNKGVRPITSVLSLGHLPELRRIERSNGAITVGAACSFTQLEEFCREALPEFAGMLAYFGSPPIKNAGTIGGNIANGSPIADALPALYVLNAEIELAGVFGTRRVNINDFYSGYKKNVMRPEELIQSVIIPLPAGSDLFKLYKISKRKDLDISSFTAAVWMRRDGSLIQEARLAFGGVGPNILRLKETEQYLQGQELSEATFSAAGPIARREIQPISDVRGSAEYRLQLAENIMLKFYFDVALAGDLAMHI